MIAIDTNVLIRYLIQPVDKNNPALQVQRAVALVDSAESVFLSDIVVAEFEWVLETVFACSRKEIRHAVSVLAGHQKFKFESWTAIQCALMDYHNFTKVDLSDCLSARRAKEHGCDTLYTFEGRSKLGGTPCGTALSK